MAVSCPDAATYNPARMLSSHLAATRLSSHHLYPSLSLCYALLVAMADHADKTQPWIPLAGGASDGWSKDGEATATCYCGAVQLAFVSAFASLG
jgi:hypothetical protein